MMQFTEIQFSPPFLPPTISPMMNKLPAMGAVHPCPGGFATRLKSISNSNFNDANCMEQLLVHCAEAIENNDPTPAQQILWVLNNIAQSDGDSTQRLTCACLRALISRAALKTSVVPLFNAVTSLHKFSLLELANFVDLTPFHRFGFTAANSVIVDAIFSGEISSVNIVDLSISHCMQMPTLIDSIATRFDSMSPSPVRLFPPMIKLTVGAIADEIPPVFDVSSYDDIGVRLVNFARSRNIHMEFKAIPTSPSDGYASILEEIRQIKTAQLINYPNHNQIILNCHMTLHLLQEEETNLNHPSSMRAMFLEALRTLEPSMVVVVEEDVDFTSQSLVGRVRSAFNHLWIPFDTMDTFLPPQREWFEADVTWKIDNVVGCEGVRRVQMQECRGKWGLRMRESEFRSVEYGEESRNEVKGMLEEHAAGWGAKKEDHDLVLTWKGHNLVFASAWLPV